ncbi:hypothetical protein FNU79_14010 [Deinococcus detaillensis]|uniref:Uncharacterized protein n=1 Tax=Deinococcus detaillensis TaxID=2592048 RepID=A0A553UPI2_9DEIO|nr:hypothetical protein [Deinococcus detaillensis]TSA82130.1 hypothetical protein FNU79_14010 [Deinococcus detaillensis]
MNASIFWPSNPLIDVLLLLIAALFLYGLWLSLQALRTVKAERQAAQEIVKLPGLMLDPGSLVLQLGKNQDRLAGQLLRSMLDQQGLAFARPADVLEPVLDTAARLIAPARTVPNLLLLFGLIGTVVGLAYTLSSLGPQIQDAINAGDPKTVAQSLGVTLKQMGGAFAGTLWGVTTAFILQAINAVAGLQAEQLAGDLDRVSLQFAPMIYPASSEKQVASLSDLVRRSEVFLADTQSKIAATSEQFAQVLKDAGGVIQKSLETLEVTSKGISEALQRASSDVRQSSEHLTHAVNAIKDHQQDFRNIYSAFSEMFDKSMQALKLHSDGELKEIRELQAAFGNSGAQIVQEIFKSTEKMNQVSQDLARGEAAYLLGTQGVTTSIKAGFDHLGTQIGDTLSTYTREVNVVSSKLEGLQETLGASQTSTTSLERTLRAKDDAERTRMKDQLQSEQTLMVATARLTTTLEQLSPVMTRLQDSPNQLVEALSARQEQLAESWRNQQEHAQALLLRATLETHEHLEHLLGALGTRVEQAAQKQATEHEDQARVKELVLLATGQLDQLTETNKAMRGISQQLQYQSEVAEQRRTQTDPEREALQGVLEHHRESALRVIHLLEALPGQLQTADLVHVQGQLTSTLDRLLASLHDLPAHLPQEGQPA